MRSIATEGESPDADDRYFAFVAASGRLLVACVDEAVIGFGGIVHVGGAVMVTDLFVTTAARGLGVGRRLLGALLDGETSITTFSSPHPAALRLYASFGLHSRARLLTMEGFGRGRTSRPLRAGSWRHGRPDVVEYFREGGAVVGKDVIAYIDERRVQVVRVDGTDPQRVVADIVARSSTTQTISLSILETAPMAKWLLRDGFRIADADIWLATDDVDGSTLPRCVHRGLC